MDIKTVFEHLRKPEIATLVAQHLHDDPATFALKHKDAIAASQIKILQKAKTKLPSFYAIQAIIPDLAFEQCSSELAASAKQISGDTCLDISAGLGVDTCYFARQFGTVTAIEQDAGLSEVLSHNLQLMQIHNVKVVNTSAEDFLTHYQGAPFDWVYVDPARRADSGAKLYLPQDCSPNVVTLFPLLQKIAKNILIKLSPMYDVDAALRQFPATTACVVLSIHNECKEILLYFSTEKTPPSVVARCYYQQIFRDFVRAEPPLIPIQTDGANAPKYIYEPDVAIYKGRFLQNFMHTYYPDIQGYASAIDGFWLSDVLHTDFCGRTFAVHESWVYQPRRLAEHLKKHGITRLNVVRRNSRDTAADIRAALKVKEGGDDYLLVTNQGRAQVAWLCRKA